MRIHIQRNPLRLLMPCILDVLRLTSVIHTMVVSTVAGNLRHKLNLIIPE